MPAFATRPSRLQSLSTVNAMRSHYEVLGVPRKASLADIKRAYRTKALQTHPDRCRSSDSAQQFLEVRKSYEVLSCPSRRVVYDQVLTLDAESSSSKNNTDFKAQTQQQYSRTTRASASAWSRSSQDEADLLVKAIQKASLEEEEELDDSYFECVEPWVLERANKQRVQQALKTKLAQLSDLFWWRHLRSK